MSDSQRPAHLTEQEWEELQGLLSIQGGVVDDQFFGEVRPTESSDPSDHIFPARPILTRGQVERVMASLTQGEEEVLQLHFGLLDGRSRSVEEMATEKGVTIEEIESILSQALKKLRHTQ
jgi:DNA-directed RNA polymerase sigma subunit (sigma70/sigma32)